MSESRLGKDVSESRATAKIGATCTDAAEPLVTRTAAIVVL